MNRLKMVKCSKEFLRKLEQMRLSDQFTLSDCDIKLKFYAVLYTIISSPKIEFLPPNQTGQ